MGYGKLNDMYPNSHRVDSAVLPRPVLMVVVDTEEDFDWAADPDRSERSVRSVSYLSRGGQLRSQILSDKLKCVEN